MRKLLLSIFTIAALVAFTACQGDIANNNNGNQAEPSSPVNNEENVEQEENQNTEGEVNESENKSGEENKEDEQTENENNSTEENEEAVDKGSSLSNYDEYSMLKDRLDLDNLSYDVVEDHHNKRVILFKNKHNHVAYKSIFIKRKNYLKIIDKKGPPVYKGTI